MNIFTVSDYLFKRTTILFLFVFLTHLSFSQKKFLALEKYGKTKRTVYNIGEEIGYKSVEEEFERTDRIRNLIYEDSLIVFEYDTLHLNEVDYIRVKPTQGILSPYNGLLVAVAGVGYFLLDILNQAVLQGQDYHFDKKTLRTSLIITGAGLIWYATKRTKFRPGRNRRIRIVDISP